MKEKEVLLQQQPQASACDPNYIRTLEFAKQEVQVDSNSSKVHVIGHEFNCSACDLLNLVTAV